MLLLAFSFGTLDALFFSSPLQAQTTPPVATPPPAIIPPPSTNAAPASTNAAPAVLPPNTEMDTETGKPIQTTPLGVKYVDIVVGTGAALKTGDRVVVKYVGKLADGTKFDASADHPGTDGTMPFELGVTHLIAGWTDGVATMKVGGKRKLIIPPILAYGQRRVGDIIPPNSTLIFEIEVVSSSPVTP